MQKQAQSLQLVSPITNAAKTFIFCSLLCFGLNSEAQTVSVMDRDSWSPIGNVTIQLANGERAVLTTNAEGKFQLPTDFPADGLKVTLTADGYFPKEMTVKEPEEITVYLQSETASGDNGFGFGGGF